MTNELNNKNFGNFIHIRAYKIHRAKSYVEFSYRDKPTTRELGDLIVISIVSDKKKRLLQKTSIIQNKKEKDMTWDIDQEQLFLLKNFPTISSSKGIFKTIRRDLDFINMSNSLGSYGLFHSPGDMIYASAVVIASLYKKNKINYDDFENIESYLSNSNTNPFGHNLFHIEDIIYFFEKYYRRFAFPWLFGSHNNFFLGHCHFTRDISDFIKNLTYFNIGEYSYVNGTIIDEHLDNFSNTVLRTIGFQEFIDIDAGNEREINNDIDIQIIVTHMDVGTEKE
ncbi:MULTISPECIES: hypothetical protein [Melioribacter]|nr:hypothetical protein [Melioribacter roseus]